MTTANRGKVAEGKVAKILAAAAQSGSTAFWRCPDAHAGSRVVAPADFMLLVQGQMWLIEVKEVAHAFRLPYANFKQENVARMRVWEYAGAQCIVLIYHSTTKKWRSLPLSVFLDRDMSVGSWDLRQYDEHDKLTLGIE